MATLVGAFTSSMTDLSAGTTYYVRAYATNTAGTSYGDDVEFTTSPYSPWVMFVSAILSSSGSKNRTNYKEDTSPKK